MNIAIQASDLDADRIDGTRVYIANLLRQFGILDHDSRFTIYHKKKFNPELAPPDFSNYRIKRVLFPFFWTQTRFAWEMFFNRPDVLWMPMQAIPFFISNRIKTVVTIHDLAFKYFPDHFPSVDLWRLNILTSLAIRKSKKLIAVSQSTKNDILKFYPQISENKIRVIHHGFDGKLFSMRHAEADFQELSKKWRLQPGKYLLYVGAIQPRKNIEILVEAFNRQKENEPELKLAIVGEKAWLWKKTLRKIEQSSFRKDIILTGKVKFSDLPILYQGAACFVFPSLYEGFGLPILEAFASGCPVIAAHNSSLPEVAGSGALYFDGLSASDLSEKISVVLGDASARADLKRNGKERLAAFSWEKCADKTLELLKENIM